MLKSIINNFKNLDSITYKIMKKGFIFCFILYIISCLILFFYNTIPLSPFVYYIGISIFKLSSYFLVEFIICGFVVDSIKKEII